MSKTKRDLHEQIRRNSKELHEVYKQYKAWQAEGITMEEFEGRRDIHGLQYQIMVLNKNDIDELKSKGLSKTDRLVIDSYYNARHKLEKITMELLEIT